MGYNLLKNKKGIIFGALDDKSLAWKTATRAFEEGAQFTLSNTQSAIRFGQINTLGNKCNAKIIPADATRIKDIEQVILQSMEILGGKVDFVVHSIGMSLNVRKHREYDDLDYDYFLKTIDISALSFHKLLQVAKKLDAIKEWGSVLTYTYIAAQRTLYGYNDMADAKALLESITRNFGYIYGREKKIRINSISQSPTKTTAGSGIKGVDGLIDFTERMSPLGNATADECANFAVVLLSDLSRKITMQNIYHDGGFSSMAMSLKAMTQYNKCLDEEK